MTASQLVAAIRLRGVELRADGDSLKYRPRHRLESDARLIGELRERKREVLEILKTREPFPPVPEGWTHKSWTERLRQMADRCEWVVPDRAEWLRGWATEIEVGPSVKGMKSRGEWN